MIKILELFGGIGACSKALERLGIEYEIADYVEIDKYAVKSYNAMHNTDFEPQDIRDWNKDIEVDLIMHGSPCQDFSLAGKQHGGDEGSGTRSSLMYETIRIIDKLKPKYVIWENVKNIISKKHKHNFDNYINRMSELGYTSYYQILNAKDYGIPQNRERVFVVSILKCKNEIDGVIVEPFTTFQFPPKQELKYFLKDYTLEQVNEKYYINNHLFLFKYLNKNKFQLLQIATDKNVKYEKNQRVYSRKGIISTIPAQKNYMPIILRIDGISIITEKEAWVLMGFDEEDFKVAAKVNSNIQLYKQAGNSIVVNVLEAILRNLLLEPVLINESETIKDQLTIFNVID